MNPLKIVAIAGYGIGLGFAYIAKSNAVSQGRSTHIEDQAIKMGQERLNYALKM